MFRLICPDFCPQYMASLNAAGYAAYRHHSVIVACRSDGNHYVTCSGHNNQRTERRFRRLLHPVRSQ